MSLISSLESINTEKLLNNLPSGVVIHQMDTTITYANKKALELLGLTWDQIIGRKAISKEWHLVNENGQLLEVEEYPVNQVITTRQTLSGFVLGVKATHNSNITWILSNAYLENHNKQEQVVVTFADISNTQNLLFKEIVDNARDAIIITSAYPIDEPDGPIIEYVNDAFCQISGYSKEEAIGQTPRILQKDDIDREALDRIKSSLEAKEPIRETLLNYSKDERPYWLDVSIFPLHAYGNKVTHFAAIERDISQIKYSELSHLEASQTDPLTGLLNRRGFDMLIQEQFLRNEIDCYCILALDIDFFKSINDTYGHELGDIVLARLATVLKYISRKDDLIARFGGEEFILFLPHVELQAAKNIAERIRKECEKLRIETRKEILKFTVSLGVKQGKEEYDVYTTITNADAALYQAKEKGRNQVVVS